MEEERAALLAGIQRDINCLSDNDRNTRKRGLTKLQQRLFTGADLPSAEVLQDVFVRNILPPCVRLLSDPVEKVRELAVGLLSHSLSSLADCSPLASKLAPALADRISHMSNPTVQEESEEIRLQLLGLLVEGGGGAEQRGAHAGAGLLGRCSPQTLEAVLPELAAVLVCAFVDPFHTIIKQACAATCLLPPALPSGALESHYPALMKSLVQSLSHRHSAVRLAVLKAVDALVIAGAPPEVVKDTVVPAVRPLAVDNIPAVRETLILALPKWMMNAQRGGGAGAGGETAEQQTSPLLAHPTHLLPLLLLTITDDTQLLGQTALAQLTALGDEYLARLKEAKVAAKARDVTPNTNADLDDIDDSTAAQVEAMKVDGEPEESGSGGGEEEEDDSMEVMEVTRPPPFTGRPPRGARTLVQALLKELLTPLFKEIKEWTVGHRLQAGRELLAVAVLAEGHVEDHMSKLVPVLFHAVGDDNADIALRVVQAVNMVGAHVSAASWVPLALESAANEKLTAQTRANTLVVVGALLVALPLGRLDSKLALQLAAMLAKEDLRASDHPGLRRQLYTSTTSLARHLAGMQSDVDAAKTCSGHLLEVLLQLQAQQEDAELRTAAAASMESVAAAALGSEGGGAEGLVALHAPALLRRLKEEEPRWEAHSPGRFLLEALLRVCGVNVLRAHLPSLIMPLLANCVALERDAHMRLAMLRLVDSLFEDPNTGAAFKEHAREAFLTLIIAPAVWRAGKTAAAVRYQAVLAGSTFLEQSLIPQDVLMTCLKDGGGLQVLPTVMTCMEEDYYQDTRRAGTFMMEQVLKVAGSALTSELRREVYPTLLKRLDDSNDEIRIRAASCCRTFFQSLSPEYDDSNTEYFTQGMVVHMDDAEPRVQEAVCLALEEAAKVKPQVLLKVVQVARQRHRSSTYCDRVLLIASESATK